MIPRVRQICRDGVVAAALGSLLALAVCPAARSDEPVHFSDVTASSGIAFRHIHGGRGQKYFVETMGAGCAFIDYNNDGRLDVFAVNGGVLPGYAGERPLNRLYRNEGKGERGKAKGEQVTFTDVTDEAGVGMTAYGMGCCAGDYDNDGYVDLYVSCYGPNSLFHNNGDGTFTDVARAAGVAGDSVWSVGCAFLDYDNDGYLDLYVGNYVDYALASSASALRPYATGSSVSPASGERFYPHPDNFKGVSDRLYHNNGDGTFTDVTERAGVLNPSGKAMGLVCGDFDDDGRADIFVANDMTPDFLYHNEGDGTFKDVGLLSGVAYSGEGSLMSSMGADLGDYDGDGRPDLIVTHFQLEGAVLYHNEGNGLFTDVSAVSGVKRVTLPYVHWGVDFVDYDNDGRVDLMMFDGHVLDNANLVGSTHAQPALLMRNTGDGRFVDVTSGDLAAPRVGRGAAFGDFDDDGDVDAFVNVNNGPAALFRNDGKKGRWLGVKLVGGAKEGMRQQATGNSENQETTGERRNLLPPASRLAPDSPASRLSNRDGIGAKVTVWAGERRQVKEVRSGSSYLSQNEFRLHFGLGDAAKADSVIVRWPGGTLDRLKDVTADRQIAVREGETPR